MMKYLSLIFLFFVSFFAILPIIHFGFFPIHDNTQVARVYEMSKALKDGIFPVRWVSDLGYGYGYPIFNFYDPFPYYIGGILNFVFDALISTKILMILGILTSAVSMYFLAKEFWGKLGGILSAIFYLYAPYHALDIYVRGDVAEFFAYSFIPLVFYGVWRTYKEKKWRYVVIASFSYAFIITSHNLTALMVTPFIFIFILLLIIKSKKNYLFLLSPLILGALLSAFYWLPAILEMRYTNVLSLVGGGSNFRDHFVCLGQLWTGLWGYGGSVAGCSDGLSFMIGKFHIIFAFVLSIFSIVLLVSKNYSEKILQYKEQLLIIILAFVGFLLSTFLMLSQSQALWEIVKPMAFIQYPWRFLILSSFFSSFIAGSFVLFLSYFIKNKTVVLMISGVIIFGFIYSSLKFFVPQKIINKNVNDYVNMYELNWIVSKTSDEYMPKSFQKPKNPEEITDISRLDNRIKITSVSKKTQSNSFILDVEKSGYYTFPIAYFPSWNGYLDGKKANVFENKKGVSLFLPKGRHNLKFVFRETRVEILSNLLTITGLLAILAGIIYKRAQK